MEGISIAAPVAKRFSYAAYLGAFLVYYGVFMGVGFLFELVAPLTRHWSEQFLLRFDMAAEILIYIPVAGSALLALKLIGERERRSKVTWAETFGAVGLRSKSIGSDVVTAVVGYIMILPVLIAAGLISDRLFHNFHTPVHPVDTIILRTQDGWIRSFLFLQAAVGAPIVEELTFRGMFLRGLRLRWGVPLSVVISSAIFALSHNTLPGGFLSLFTLGAAFAIVSIRNQSILPGILMHALNNGFVTILAFTVFSQ